MFAEGKKVGDVQKVYPDVPRKTLYDWLNEWGRQFRTESTHPTVTLVSGSNNNLHRNVTPPGDNVIVQFRDENENDIKWLKRKLKEIIKCEDADSETVKLKAVRVQAINSYLQVIKHEVSAPANNTETSEWEELGTNYDDMDENDLAIRIKERLRKA
jgi:hypothetical protein